MTVFSADVRFVDVAVLLSFLYLTLNKFAYLLMRVSVALRKLLLIEGGTDRNKRRLRHSLNALDGI